MFHSPDTNSIENVWSVWEAYLGAVMGDLNGRPHGQEQMVKVAQEEWEDLPWGRIYGWITGMLNSVHTLYRRNGGPTCWWTVYSSWTFITPASSLLCIYSGNF